jgi:hypothetical protein
MDLMLVHVIASSLAVSGALQGIIDKLRADDPVRGGAIAASIDRSTALKKQLNQLAESGQLKAIVVAADSTQEPFGGSPRDGIIRLGSSILESAAGSIAKSDLDPAIFYLGYQAATMAGAEVAEARQNMIMAPLRNHVEGQPIDATQAFKDGMEARAEADAAAVIVGWDDSLEASLQSYGRRPGWQQGMTIIRYLPFARTLESAVAQPNLKLHITPNLRIQSSQSNIQALAHSLLNGGYAR